MKTILLLCGGRSDEHEISLISSKCILDALDRKRFTPLVVGISKKTGKWHLEDEKTFYVGEFRADKIRLNEKAPTVTLAPFSQNNRGTLLAEGKPYEFDAVFPILHGPFGEDGTMQGLLDIVGVPYVGSGCGSSWLCMDKVLTKTLCQDAGIPVAEYVWVTGLEDLAQKAEAIRRLGTTIFVKPARLGSSVGITRVRSEKELSPAVEAALKFDQKVLIERGIEGREIECAVLGDTWTAKASLPGEIIPSAKIGWYSYEAKYLLADGADTVAPASLDAVTTQAVQDLCLRVYRLLECNGMARVDLFLDKSGKLYLNEVNTIPGFTPISMYPKMWQVTGVSYPDLISELLRLAFARLKIPL